MLRLRPSSSASLFAQLPSSQTRTLSRNLRRTHLAAAMFTAPDNTRIQQPPPPVQVAKRLEKFKTPIFTTMSQLAIKHGAINLGQGFPNFDGPDFVKEAAIQAIRDGKNQYGRGYGWGP